MKLAIVSPFPPEISGVGQYGLRLSQGLAASGAFESITVLANHAPTGLNATAPEGLSVRRVWQRDWAGSAPAILQAIKDCAPDVVWFNFGLSIFGRSRWANFMGLATPMLAKVQGWPAVVTLHEIFEAVKLSDLGAANGRLTQLGGQAATRMLLRADRVCFTLGRYVEEVRARYGAANLAHIPVGAYDPPELLPANGGPPEVLLFATHAPYKGLPLMLQAFAELRHHEPEARLTVAGGDHPRFPGYLESVRRSSGDIPNVRWTGPVAEADLRGLFGAAQVVVLPCRATTGASSVIHRAATFGRPAIVSDLPDTRALAAEEGLWLEFVPPGDCTALVAATRGLLADPARREAMADQNLAAMQRMTLADTSAAYVSLFQQAYGMAPAGSATA